MLRCINRRRAASRTGLPGRRVRRAGQAAAAIRPPNLIVIAHVDHAAGFDPDKHPDARSDDGARPASAGRRAIDACMRPFALRRRSHRSARGSRASMMRSDSIDAGIRRSRRCACRREKMMRCSRMHASPCSAASITSLRARIARVDDACGFDRKKHPEKRRKNDEKSCAHTHAVTAASTTTSTVTSTVIAVRACAADVGLAAMQGARRPLVATSSEFDPCETP